MGSRIFARWRSREQMNDPGPSLDDLDASPMTARLEQQVRGWCGLEVSSPGASPVKKPPLAIGHATVYCCVVVLCIAVSDKVCTVLQPFSVEPTEVHAELFADHAVPAFLFLSIAVQTGIGVLLETRQEPRDIAAPVMAVSSITGLYYIYGHFQKLTLTASYLPGGAACPMRYLMWGFTTPCFIFSAGSNTGWDQQSINFFITTDIVMIVTGYLATFEESMLCWIAETVCRFMFLVTIAGWIQMEVASFKRLSEQAGRHFTGKPGEQKRWSGLVLRKQIIGGIIMVSWTGFPMTWYSRKFGWIDMRTEEMLYVYLDLMSKGLYALCQSGLERSIMNMLWESAMVEQVVGQALDQTQSTLLKQSSSSFDTRRMSFEGVRSSRTSPSTSRTSRSSRTSMDVSNSQHGSDEANTMMGGMPTIQDWERPCGPFEPDFVFPNKDLSKLPAHYEVEGFLEILLVDSDLEETVMMMDLARSMGASVTHCADPAAAVRMFVNCGNGNGGTSNYQRFSSSSPTGRGTPPTRKVRPDVVFVSHDHERRDDWLELVSWITASFDSKLPTIMLISPEAIALDDQEVLSRALSSGASDFMIRPVYRVSLHTRVKNLLEIIKGREIKRDRDSKTDLLQRMIPQRVMNQLLSGQGVIADSHPDVTILFADIVGFTHLSAHVPTSEIILILNELFSEFDRAVDKANVYKVETIGDCYMCAAGHDGDEAHAERMVDMAKRMIDAVSAFKSSHDIKMRIGIHTGKVFTGIVGTKCPRWCFFGDTVNTASRMESTSFPMCIQISGTTQASLQKEGANVETVAYPTLRDIKGKGSMATYLVKYGDCVRYLGNLAKGAAEFNKAVRLSTPAQLMHMGAMKHSQLDAGSLDTIEDKLPSNIWDTDGQLADRVCNHYSEDTCPITGRKRRGSADW